MTPVPVADADDYGPLIREAAATFMRDTDTLGRARNCQDNAVRGKAPDRTAWNAMAELGWFGLTVPEERGGSGLGIREQLILHEEAGKALLPEPLGLGAFLPVRIATGCSGPAAGRLAEDIAAGERLVVVAWQGRANAIGSGDVSISAKRQGDTYVLAGKALYVRHAEMADAFLVAARGEEGIGIFLIGPHVAGLSVDIRAAADGSGMGTLNFDNVTVGSDALVGLPGEGGRALDAALEEARLTVCAEMLGIMQGVFERTLDYLRTRKQFGKPIGSFQALQHRAVDLYVQIELSRASLTRAVRVLSGIADGDRHVPAVAHAVSAAKARISDACLAVVKEGIQLHGAIAYTEEYDIGLFVRRALVLAAILGNSTAHRRRFGKLNLAYLAA